MLKKIFVSFLFIGSIYALSIAQSGPSLSEEVIENLKARVDGGVNAGIVVGLIDSDGVSYYSYGLKSVNSQEKVDEHSVFEIGSISKTFTGLLLADRVLKGKMKLDDPLQMYLPEGVKAPERNGASIQMVHLSNHTSALPRLPDNFNPANPGNPYADYSEKQLYDFLSSYELTRDIGSAYEYSNYAQGLLGHTLAAQSNMTYEELLIKVITGPLGMKDTRITFSPDMKKNLAMGHSGGIEVENWDLPTLAGAGAIRSTAVDMVNYISANMGKTKTYLYPAMELAHKNTRKDGAEPIVGLGWHTMVIDDEEIVWHNGGTGGYRTFSGFIKGGEKGVVVLSNSDVGVDDIGIHLLHPASPLEIVKPSIAQELRKIIDKEGVAAGAKAYWKLKKEKSDEYDFSEAELNTLGYIYLNNKENEKAIAVFKINIEAYPEAFNVYDSMGEAYMENGDNEKAIVNYKKSVELNPGNTGGIAMLKKLGVDASDIVKEVEVADEVLQSYVGEYELMPNFTITITKEGTQLKGQATGQAAFEIYPSAENVFYLKVVAAQITFNKNAEGKVDSLVLFQGGQEMPGRRLE